jgi:hypothetical protein
MPDFSLGDTHMNAFGRIAYGYANVEVGIKFCIGGMLQLNSGHAMTITAPYQAYSVASVAKCLADETLKPELAKRLRKLINRWIEYTSLRTAVAHHRWRPGTRPDSIRPTFFDIKTGEIEVKGFDPTERDYTTPELFALANELWQLRGDVLKFMHEAGLNEIIERKDAAISEKIASSEGK